MEESHPYIEDTLIIVQWIIITSKEKSSLRYLSLNNRSHKKSLLKLAVIINIGFYFLKKQETLFGPKLFNTNWFFLNISLILKIKNELFWFFFSIFIFGVNPFCVFEVILQLLLIHFVCLCEKITNSIALVLTLLIHFK